MSILDDIISEKRQEVARNKRLVSADSLRDSPWFAERAVSLATRLMEATSSGVIAEFKRRSPSKGVINADVRPEEVARGYSGAGASGISVLTDERFFGGSPDDLRAVRNAVDLPILRKEFIIDAYQVVESRAFGADVILLIAACLEASHCRELAAQARETGLEVLLELHDTSELDHVGPDVSMVGINNRNLKTFEVDLQHSVRLAGMLDPSVPTVAESGISDSGTVRHLREHGFSGFLIGESFMKAHDPGAACAEFIRAIGAPAENPDGRAN